MLLMVLLDKRPQMSLKSIQVYNQGTGFMHKRHGKLAIKFQDFVERNVA